MQSGLHQKTQDRRVTEIVTYGLTNFDTIKIADKTEIFHEIDVWHGVKKKLKLC